MNKIECEGVGDNDGFFEMEVKASPKERVVMFQNLTKTDIEGFEFVAETPAGGMAYYSNELDIAAINYRDHSKIFYDRKITHGICAASFDKNLVIERT